jgi:hypothetical protein
MDTAVKKPDVKGPGEELMHSMKTSGKSLFSVQLVVLLLVVAILGLGTGYLLAGAKNTSKIAGKITNIAGGSSVEKGKSYGDGDESVFKDIADGKMTEGGIEGEGQYHLVRPGGDSQNVYLTSSTVDLSLFIGREVKVWGQTQKAQRAGWLMDVGKVQVLE